MDEKNDSNATAAPRYRQRMPAGENAAPKSAENAANPALEAPDSGDADRAGRAARPKEVGGPKGPEPTRFGDWERDGRCVDF